MGVIAIRRVFGLGVWVLGAGSATPAWAVDLRIYIANQSHQEMVIINSTEASQAPGGNVLLGAYEPSSPEPEVPLPRGGPWVAIPSGHTVYIKLETEPQASSTTDFALLRGPRLIGTLTYTVTMPGGHPRVTAEVLPNVNADLADDDIFIFHGIQGGPMPRTTDPARVTR